MKSGLSLKIGNDKPAAKKPKKIADAVEGSPEEEAGESPDYEQHEVDNAADTIMKAHEHMANPKMMKQVNPILDRKKKAITSLDDLRAIAKTKTGSDRMEA